MSSINCRRQLSWTSPWTTWRMPCDLLPASQASQAESPSPSVPVQPINQSKNNFHNGLRSERPGIFDLSSIPKKHTIPGASLTRPRMSLASTFFRLLFAHLGHFSERGRNVALQPEDLDDVPSKKEATGGMECIW